MIIKEPITSVLIKPATIFNAEIETESVKLNNFQSAKFIVATGEGTIKSATARVVAVCSENDNEKLLEEKQIEIGGNIDSSFVVDSDKLGHDGFDTVCLRIDNAGDSNIIGCIFVVVGSERYSV